jgi:hypothetical protein
LANKPKKMLTTIQNHPDSPAVKTNRPLRPKLLAKSTSARRIPPLGARSQFISKSAPPLPHPQEIGFLDRIFRLLGLGTPA